MCRGRIHTDTCVFWYVLPGSASVAGLALLLLFPARRLGDRVCVVPPPGGRQATYHDHVTGMHVHTQQVQKNNGMKAFPFIECLH